MWIVTCGRNSSIAMVMLYYRSSFALINAHHFPQGAEVDVDDIKRVYSYFMDEHRSTQLLQVHHRVIYHNILYNYSYIQWNLRIKDNLGPGILSLVLRLVFLRGQPFFSLRRIGP